MIARRRLEKVVSSLATRQSPRCSAWANGLMSPDSLRSQHHQHRQQQEQHSPTLSSASSVSMSIKESRAQHRMLERLVDLKAVVAQTIATAAKLWTGTAAAKASMSSSISTSNNNHSGGSGCDGVVVSSIQSVLELSESTRSRQPFYNVRSIERRRHDRSRLSRKRSMTIQIKYHK